MNTHRIDCTSVSIFGFCTSSFAFSLFYLKKSWCFCCCFFFSTPFQIFNYEYQQRFTTFKHFTIFIFKYFRYSMCVCVFFSILLFHVRPIVCGKWIFYVPLPVWKKITRLQHSGPTYNNNNNKIEI